MGKCGNNRNLSLLRHRNFHKEFLKVKRSNILFAYTVINILGIIILGHILFLQFLKTTEQQAIHKITKSLYLNLCNLPRNLKFLEFNI